MCITMDLVKLMCVCVESHGHWSVVENLAIVGRREHFNKPSGRKAKCVLLPYGDN